MLSKYIAVLSHLLISVFGIILDRIDDYTAANYCYQVSNSTDNTNPSTPTPTTSTPHIIIMADTTKINRPLTRDSVRAAHDRIKPYIHLTPVLQCETISTFVSTPQPPSALIGTEYEGQEPARPKMNIFFKCENYQRIGAFKARGAFHALSRLTDKQLEKGVITHSVSSSSSLNISVVLQERHGETEQNNEEVKD